MKSASVVRGGARGGVGGARRGERKGESARCRSGGWLEGSKEASLPFRDGGYLG